MTLSLKIALRFLKSDRNQTLFIIFGIAVGISVQILVGVLVQSLQNDLTDELVGNSAHILIKSNLDEKTISSWEEITSQVEKTDSVTSVNAVVDMPGLLKSRDGSASILIRGFNFEDANEIYELDTAIYESTELDHGYEVIVGKNLKERLDLEMDDVIQIITPDGRFSSFKVTGFYDLGLAIINESWIIMDFETAQNLFKLDGTVTSIEIQVEDVFTADTISDQIENEIKNEELTVTNWKIENGQFLNALQAQSSASFMIQFFVLGSVVIGIASVLGIKVVQKSKQIGILKAMGANNRTASMVFVYQGVIVGVLGSVLGLGICLINLWAYLSFGDNASAINIHVNEHYRFMFLSMLAGVVVAIISTILPARRSSKLSPVEVMKIG